MNSNSLREYPANRRGKVRSVERITDKDWLLGFEGPLPEFQNDDLLDNITWNPNITVCNNKVDMDSVRGFLFGTRGKIVVAYNTLNCHGPGVLVEGDGKGWMESSPIRDMLIEENLFLGCQIDIRSSVKGTNPLEPVHENIRILNNTFKNVSASGAKHRQGRLHDGVRDGKVEVHIHARQVKGLVVKGNRADQSPDLVTVDADGSCSDLQIEKK